MQIVGSRLQVTQHRVKLFACLLLLLAASGARLLSFDRFLPYVDHNDEPNMYLLARDWRGIEHDPVVPTWLAGYPPLYVWINVGVQQAVEALWTKPWLGPADYYYALRLCAALVGIITTALIFSIATQLAGPVAGWFAGLIWSVSPTVVENNNWAIPDPFVYLACALALAAALRSWRRRSPGWATVSLVAGILAIYLKYSMVYALIPWFAAMLGLLRTQRKRTLPWLGLQAALSAGAAAYLIFGYGALRLGNRESNTVRGEGLALMLNPQRNLNNATFAILPIGFAVFLLVLVGALVAYRYSRRRQWPVVSPGWPGIFLVYSAIGILISASFTNVGELLKMRFTLPVSIALIALWGAGVAQIVSTLQKYAQCRPASRAFRAAPLASLVLIGGAAGLPLLFGMAQRIQTFRLPDTRYLLWQWTDANIPANGRILTQNTGDLERTWNRNWGGYNGVKTFEMWYADDPTTSTPQDYYRRDIVYFAVSQHDIDTVYRLPGMDRYVSQLTLLKKIPSPDDSSANVAGPTVFFYRMVPPGTALQFVFGGEIALVGYDLEQRSFRPGDTITFTPYWRIASKKPTVNYSMFVHLDPEKSNQQIAQYDGPPSTAQRPTLTWDDPAELFIGSGAALTIPKDAPPGSYRLVIGLYDFSTGQRLKDAQGVDSISIPITLSSLPGEPAAQ